MAKKWTRWTEGEIAEVLAHPELTAAELAARLPKHTEKAVRRMRERLGRYSGSNPPVCSICHERPVWAESANARRYGLCKGCYLDEERMRLEDSAKSAAVRKLRSRTRRKLKPPSA